MSLWKRLGLVPDEAPSSGSDAEAVRRIANALNRLDPERARYLAMFAYVLSRVADVDLEVTDSEMATMERVIMEEGGLPEEQALMVVQMARSQSLLFSGTDDFLVTREFDRIATREQKMSLLNCLFAVSASDASIATVEDNEIRRIARELRLEHADFVAVRARYRDKLAVLHPPSSSGHE